MRNMSPTVSVIIPTHNRELLIGQTIQSVLDQTYTDFEILVVDNGSTDQTRVVVEAIDDPRVHYHFQENTGGPAGPRNSGIALARGRYIAFLDSDDLWLPEKLKAHVAIMEEHSELGLVFGQHRPFGPSVGVVNPFPDLVKARSGMVFENLFLSWNFIPCLEALVRRSALEEVGVFDEDSALRNVEDYDLWLRLARQFPIKFVPGVTSRYRLHGNQLSDGDPETQFLLSMNVTIKFAMRGWVGRRLCINRISRLYASTIRHLPRKNRWSALLRVSMTAAVACWASDYIRR